MKYADVAENVKQLLDDRPSQDEFIYELLLAYGKPKASITRLKEGTFNQSKVPGEVLWKKELYFKIVGRDRRARRDGQLGDLSLPTDLFAAIEELKTAKGTKTHNPRFLFVTDFEQILAIDRKTNDTLDIKFQRLETNFDFFLPWAGMEKYTAQNETLADIKAAEKMAKLFDAIKQDNPDYMRHDAHSMNVFLGRLLFCLFAEDTGIFEGNAVTNAIASHTAVDGSDLDAFFKQLFDWLDTPDNKRKLTTESAETQSKKNLSASVSSSAAGGKYIGIRNLPYVNGGLFREHFDIPEFSAKSRRMIIEAGSLTWAEINPDIFGSMFQAVIDPEERHNLGQHYTSVTNIMKVIEPLFLNDFKEELERARNLSQKNVRIKALNELHDRIAKVKIFDPACGSGNFLIIAYKELRKLEMELFEAMNAFPVSRITVDQFYGIEIADFACETATLSLWLAEHQMNLEFTKRFGHSLTSLPLKDGAHVVCGNACRIDWETVCPKNSGDEIYILGNPPYLGSSIQNQEQKADMARVFTGTKDYKNLDYIACWFWKGAAYIKGANAQSAFVSTNSICQGEQVALLWPHIFSKGLEIGFAHQSFKWANHAKGNAGVTCVIVGLRNKEPNAPWIYRNGIAQSVKTINAYLTAGSNVVIKSRSQPVSRIPKMSYGNKPVDGGNLILSDAEKDMLLEESPETARFLRKLIGASEFINGTWRWCLWIKDCEIENAMKIHQVADRINKVRAMRLASTDTAANDMAKFAHRFREQKCAKKSTLIVPAHTSENRVYVPFGFLDASVVVTNSAQVIYDPEPWVFGVISARMHMIWVRATCGMLETRIRYSSALCYNTFPIPDLTEEQKQTITMHVGNVLEEREKHPEKTMAQLYDPDKMPAGLREAHHQLDLAVDRIYRSKPFASDEERLEHLFKRYEEMTVREKLI